MSEPLTKMGTPLPGAKVQKAAEEAKEAKDRIAVCVRTKWFVGSLFVGSSFLASPKMMKDVGF